MGIFALLVWLLGTPLFVWFGYMLRHVQYAPDRAAPPQSPVRPIDATARKGEPVLLFGGDGQIMEGRWVTARQAAREFGGKARDYSDAWISWDEEEVNFTPRGYMPVPALPNPSPETSRS